MKHGNLSTFLIVLSVIVMIVLCAAWPRHNHDQVTTHQDIDGYADSRRVCTEEMVPALLSSPDTIAYTGVAVSELTGQYRVTGTAITKNPYGGQLKTEFVCAVILKDNTTWFATELRLI